MFVPILLFGLGLVLLIKGGDWFVDGATGIAHRFHVPELLIGATVVSIGTTLPEVMVSATSAIGGHGEIAYGNAIGSIICNTSLIAALTISVRPSKVDRKALCTPVIFFFAAALFYSLVAYIKRDFSRTTGILLIAAFVVYMAMTVYQAFHQQDKQLPDLPAQDSEKGVEEQSEEALTDAKKAKLQFWKDIILLIVGAALIAIGANLLVDNGTVIAEKAGVPESVIALTFVALGTSLPELVTAITALVKGHGALSLGNVIGANLFNLVLVSGISITLSPFEVPSEKLIGGLPSSLAVEIPVMLFVMAFMTLPALIRGKLFRFQGIVLLCIYAGFCAFQFVG